MFVICDEVVSCAASSSCGGLLLLLSPPEPWEGNWEGRGVRWSRCPEQRTEAVRRLLLLPFDVSVVAAIAAAMTLVSPSTATRTRDEALLEPLTLLELLMLQTAARLRPAPSRPAEALRAASYARR